MKRALFLTILPCLAVITSFARAQDTKQSEGEAMYYRYLEFPSYVKGGSITPHWMADGSSFWYAEGAPANTVIWKVDPKANTKTPLFDAARLRKALTPLLGHAPPYQGLPFDTFSFVGSAKSAVQFSLEGKKFVIRLDSYDLSQVPTLSGEEKTQLEPQVISTDVAGHTMAREVLSPDGHWFGGHQDHNLYLRSTLDGQRVSLTTNGIESDEWLVADWDHKAQWSPNSLKLAVKKVDSREAPKLPVVHWLGPREQVEWVGVRSDFSTTKAGMSLPRTELFILDIISRRRVRVDLGNDSEQHLHILRWLPDSSELLFLRADRLLKTLDLMAANPETGATRVILRESQNTFIVGVDIFYQASWLFSLFESGKKFIWLSERDSWNHLYLYDIQGRLIRKLTEGEFPAIRLEAIDDNSGWVYFAAHGDRQRPYDTQLFRVRLDGTRLAQLTEGLGEHSVQFSPSKEFFLDTHSSVDRAPRVELRRTDGKLLQILSTADTQGLQALRWKAPEEFVAQAADGRTPLYGVIYKPYDFDPDKKYPVIEWIYGCPQVAVVARAFVPQGWARTANALAQLGFVTFMVDGRGTPERGKEFQDFVFRQIGRYEIPDHVAVLKQLAEKRPYLDLTRVGVTGHSCGGYFTLRALLLAPEVYRVGVASAPMTDLYYGNAMELYMGLPQSSPEAYEYASNVRLAGSLQGKLLLIHGASDYSVPLSATMKMVDALIRASKPFDLLLLPEQDHGYTGVSASYARDATRRYFQEHLKP